MYKIMTFLFLAATLTILTSCQNEDKQTAESFEVVVRLDEEPDRLNPMLSQASVATQIENHIFLPLMEYDPIDLELKPILVKSNPEITPFGENGSAYTYEIKENAQWSDGKKITAEDYLFTIKAALNPHTSSNSWRGFLSQLDSVSLDPENDRKFTVYLDEAYLLSQAVTCNFNIYPKHFYDPDGLLDDYTFSDMRKDSLGDKAEAFGKRMNEVTFSRDSILGSGAYEMTSWNAGQSLVLKKVKNWWGEGSLPASPDQITYLLVPDEATAVTMLKSGDVDIMSSVSPTVFADLKASEAASKLAFHTPQIMQYYYLGLNNGDEILRDKKVRLALAHLLDVQKMCEVLMADLAQPVTGPVHPSKAYYNKSLSPIAIDIDKASALLEEAGWMDKNNDGVREKNIDGKSIDLNLDILVTQKELGRNVARLLKDNAAKVGMNIEIKAMEWGQIMGQLGSRDFDIVAMATRQHPGLDDLYQSWHTASIGPDGRNISGFGNAKSDSIIEVIRLTEDIKKRDQAYQDIQAMIYEEQPVVFLFSPTETIIHGKDISVDVSSRRPGYFENTAKPAQ